MADTQKQDDLLPEDEGKGGLCADKTAQLKSPVKPTALLDAKLKTKEVHANVNVPPASSKWGSSIRIRPEHQAELDQLRGQLLRSLEDKKKKKRAGICGTIVARNAALNVEQVLPSSSEIETNSLQQQINLSQGHGLDAQTAKDADGVRNIPPVDPLATSQTLSPHEEPGLEDQEDDLEALDVEEVESMLVVVDTRLRGE
ncbi:hypothetical protein CALVIDRAFT_528457 [Calocera viscosa TUFC12733]|uniref:Uncharacterized protein n=1 Tax=Calocera viscosa (strain TUFC12733) TaxID=1330018 RepID=A0A167KMB3_CALVF|nr:hypothetical protein CALVIDRAFT_528457 [Calocera viscosa TUFC12733]